MSLFNVMLQLRPGNVFRACAHRMQTSNIIKPSTYRAYQNQSTAERERMRKQEMRSAEAKSMERNFTRDWRVGDVYAPHDLSAAEARKWRRKYSPTSDAFDALNLNPLDMYKNFAVMSEYVTDMGRIRPRSSTGLRRVNQRRIAKAIRRAVALGLMPSVHKHPEIIRMQTSNRIKGNGGRQS